MMVVAEVVIEGQVNLDSTTGWEHSVVAATVIVAAGVQRVIIKLHCALGKERWGIGCKGMKIIIFEDYISILITVNRNDCLIRLQAFNGKHI
jgi:hypothetical protein